MTPLTWKRYRFMSDADDYRPVKFPPPGPYWCSGYDSEDRYVMIVYLPQGVKLLEYWPEAIEIEENDAYRPQFTSRFPRPEWYSGEGETLEEGKVKP